MEGGWRILLADCENQLLREIAEPCLKRRDVAQTYRLAMESVRDEGEPREAVDWAKVNRAIVARWSTSGLTWIKTQAHSGKCFTPPTINLRRDAR